MEIEYRVSEDGLRIDAFPKGILDIETTLEYFKKIQNDERIKSNSIEVVYFNDVTDFKISYLESENITQKYQEAKKQKEIRATIFVCESILAFGIARMLQTFHEITNPQHTVRLVRSGGEISKVIKEI